MTTEVEIVDASVTVEIGNTTHEVEIADNEVSVDVGAGGISTLAALLDVTITSIADDDLIVWDSASSRFVNLSYSEAGLATAADLQTHIIDNTNPHSVTASQVGALPLAGGTMVEAAAIAFTDHVILNSGGATQGFLFNTSNDVLDTDGDVLIDIQNNSSSVFKIDRYSSVGRKISTTAHFADFGNNNTVTNGWCFGDTNISNNAHSLVVGQNHTANSTYGTTLGFQNVTGGNGNTAIGLNCSALSLYNCSIGTTNAITAGFGAVALGANNNCDFGFTTGVALGGGNTVTSGNLAVAIGSSNSVGASSGIAVGVNNSLTNFGGGMALGTSCDVSGNNSIAIGRFAVCSGVSSVCIGTGNSITNKLDNTVGASMAFGVNSTIPTMWLTDSGGVGGVGNLLFNDGANIQVDTTTGTQIATAATQKLGFFGVTPIVQPAANPDTSGATLTQLETEVNEVKQTLRNLGLMA